MRRSFALLPAALGLALLPQAAARPAGLDVGALRGELQDSTRRREDARAEVAALKDDISRLQAQLAELQAVQAAGLKSTDDTRARLDALNVREAALSRDMGRNRSELAQLLGALELYRRDPPPALLVSPRSAEDAVRAAILVRAVQPELARRAAVFRARAEELQRVRRAITSVSGDLFTSESSLAENRAAIERTIRDKAALERQLEADAVDADRRAQVLNQRLRTLGAAPGLAASGPVTAPAAAPSRLRAPAQGALVRRFGQPGPGGSATSDGLTWRTPPAAVVRAPAAGVVEYAGPLKGWGGVLILDVGGGERVVLAGLDQVFATPGRRISLGETLGAMPARPAPDLYLELRRGSAPIDPAPLLQ
jgi:septal ring factor EnvC (AmiA/AmiB activator)